MIENLIVAAMGFVVGWVIGRYGSGAWNYVKEKFAAAKAKVDET